MAEGWRGRSAWVAVDLDAIRHNVCLLRARSAARCMFAVVKADGYGHGAVAVARTALSAGADRVAVFTVDEGVLLRRAGISAPILVMGYLAPGEAGAVVEHDLTATVVAIQQAVALCAAGRAAGQRVPVHVKVDTGMGRAGVRPSEVSALAQRLGGLEPVYLEGIFTHFATADEPDLTHTRRQLEAFAAVLGALEAAGVAVPLRHAANSAATLALPEGHLDAVRCGVAMYGLSPSCTCGPDAGLRPALSLRARIARVFDRAPGESVGYGRTFVAERPTRVALATIGYGDGLSRALSNRGGGLVHGQRVPLIGRVSMDQCTFDVTGLPAVSAGDEIVLLGRQGAAEITADEVAGLLGTINYEVVTALSPRLPRLYYEGGRLAGWRRLGDLAPCWAEG